MVLATSVGDELTVLLTARLCCGGPRSCRQNSLSTCLRVQYRSLLSSSAEYEKCNGRSRTGILSARDACAWFTCRLREGAEEPHRPVFHAPLILAHGEEVEQMSRWKIALSGSGIDLDMLLLLSGDDRFAVRKVDGKYILQSVEFESLDSPGAVWDCAITLVRRINGAARVLFDDHSNVTVDKVIHEHPDGSQQSIAYASGTATARVRARCCTSVVRADGTEEGPACNKVHSWVNMASHSEDVAEVLRYFEGDYLAYFDLYKIYEIVTHNCESRGVSFDKYLSKKDEAVLRANINCPALSGDDARHARPLGRPKSIRSMGHAKVAAMVRELVRKWLDDLVIG